MDNPFLRIYMNDQLALGILRREVARRSHRKNRGTELGEALARVADAIAEDVETFEAIMKRLGIPRSAVKLPLAVAVERVGRLKLNGRLIEYSPLSRFAELDFLAIGIDGKKLLWANLRDLADLGARLSDVDFDHLIARAERQRADLEPFRSRSGAEVLAGKRCATGRRATDEHAPVGMAEPGERIEDALSGATIVFRQTAAETDGDLLQIEVSARPRLSAGPLHIHPRQEEWVHVLSGRLRSRVGGVEREHRPSEVVRIPPGTPHTLTNPGDEDLRLLVEFRPALRTESLFQTFFGVGPGRRTAARLRDLVRLLVATRGYRDEMRIAWRSLL